MSEYQYYEFCRIHEPLSPSIRQEMASLSSRARITTHGVSYVYHYGDFRGHPKQLLLKYFDVFFYISNWGTVRLMFKYSNQQVDIQALKQYTMKSVIECEQQGQNILLEVTLRHEEGSSRVEGEGLLSDLLPLYQEIQEKNYQFLRLVSAIQHAWRGSEHAFRLVMAEPLSLTQKAFLETVGMDQQTVQ